MEILHWEPSPALPDPAMGMDPPLSLPSTSISLLERLGCSKSCYFWGRKEVKLAWTNLRKAVLAGLGDAQNFLWLLTLFFPKAAVPGARGVSVSASAQHLALTGVDLGELREPVLFGLG